MSRCVRIKRKKRQVCIGDLDTSIQLQNRDIKGLVKAGEVDFTEEFSDSATVWALVETKNGLTAFDSSNIESAVTHKILIQYDPTVTAQTWIELDSRKFDIITVENLDERNQHMFLLCKERGDSSIPVNLA